MSIEQDKLVAKSRLHNYTRQVTMILFRKETDENDRM